jgi:uncharacterized protein YbaR (Trm112 family)
MIDRRLLDMMACPRCRGAIHEKGMFLLCKKCALAFPVLDDSVPNMILDESWPLTKAEKSGFRHELTM